MSSLTPEQSLRSVQNAFIHLVGTILVNCIVQEILERKCGFAPVIRRRESLDEMPEITKKITRRVDKQDNFRVQIPYTYMAMRGPWCLTLISVVVYELIVNPHLFVRVFIQLDDTTKYETSVCLVASSIIGFYLWELSVNRQWDLTVNYWGVVAHHLLAIINGIFVICGVFNPFAIWYGISGVMMAFPIYIILGFRGRFGPKYPKITRRLFAVAWIWYSIFCLIGNIPVQISLVIYGAYTGKIPVPMLIIVSISILVWTQRVKSRKL